jgi:hypothetical protein
MLMTARHNLLTVCCPVHLSAWEDNPLIVLKPDQAVPHLDQHMGIKALRNHVITVVHCPHM